MQDLIITLVQANQFWEDKAINLQHYEDLLSTTHKSDVILLPEMFHTGFTMNASDLAETSVQSTGLAWLKTQALQREAAIYTSLIMEEGGCYFNQGVFVEPNGAVTTYNKQKLFALASEDDTYTSGKHSVIVEYKGWKIKLLICYDLRFPEIARNRIAANQLPEYDVLLYVANWPMRRSVHWKSLLQARAIENQCFVAGVNRVGTDGKGLEYSGDSMLVTPLGEIVSCDPGKEQCLTQVLKYSDLQFVREQLPFLKDM